MTIIALDGGQGWFDTEKADKWDVSRGVLWRTHKTRTFVYISREHEYVDGRLKTTTQRKTVDTVKAGSLLLNAGHGLPSDLAQTMPGKEL